MVVELKGQQIRIRKLSPRLFHKFRTQSTGQGGKVQIILGIKNHKSRVQAYRINLNRFGTYKGVSRTLNGLQTSASHKHKARVIAKKWFKR